VWFYSGGIGHQLVDKRQKDRDDDPSFDRFACDCQLTMPQVRTTGLTEDDEKDGHGEEARHRRQDALCYCSFPSCLEYVEPFQLLIKAHTQTSGQVVQMKPYRHRRQSELRQFPRCEIDRLTIHVGPARSEVHPSGPDPVLPPSAGAALRVSYLIKTRVAASCFAHPNFVPSF
jgi:hypothetical protein